MVFYCSWLTASLLKSPGLFSVFWPFLNKVVVWMVSIRPPTSKSSSPFSNPLVTVPNAPITIGVYNSFFLNFLARSRYLSFFSHSFSFIRWSAGTAKSTILQVLFFCWLLLGLVFCSRLGDPRVCQSPIGVYVCYFLFVRMVKFKFLAHLLVDHLAYPVESSLILTFDPAVRQETVCIRSEISRYNRDRGRVEFGAIATPTGSRWVSNNDITRCHRQFKLVGVSYLEFELQFEAGRTSCQQRAWALRTPVEQPSRIKKCCYNTEELVVNMLQSVSSQTHLSHATLSQPFRIKSERYIFLKCVRSSLLLVMFPHVYVYV